MRARVVRVQTEPEQADEAANLFRDAVVPAAKQQPGFEGALLLVDPDTGKGLSVTMWEDEATMERGEDSGYYKEQLAKFGALFTEPPRAEHYEVRVQA
jgi:heme-degrading monooxygenase HmoA